MSKEKTETTPSVNWSKAAAILLAGEKSYVEAAEIVGHGVKTKLVQESLEKHGVPAHCIKRFVAVYRAYSHARSNGYTAEDCIKMDPVALRMIGNALGNSKTQSRVNKQTYKLAMGDEAASNVLHAIDPKKHADNKKRERAKARFDALPAGKKFAELLKKLAGDGADLGLTPRQMADMFNATADELAKGGEETEAEEPVEAETEAAAA